MNDAALLVGGDVYSLGRLLQLIANANASATGEKASATAQAEQLVEGAMPDVPAELGDLTDLVARMTRRLPEQRPSLEEVIDELAKLHLSLAPAGTIRARIKAGKLDEARAQLQALVAAPRDTSKSELCLLQAELALALPSPDFQQAIAELTRASDHAPKEPGPKLALGEAYRRFTAHPQHGQLAVGAFWQAAELSGWRPEGIARWLEVARAVLQPDELVQGLVALSMQVGVGDVVSTLTPEEIVRFRLRMGDKVSARDACLDWCSGHPFDERILATAQLVAAAFPPTELMRWMYQTEKVRKSDLMQGVIWQANGNELVARQFLDRARGATDQENDDGALR
jgi:hypothetical protein